MRTCLGVPMLKDDNLIGAVLWTVGISMLGYVVGRSISIDKYILPIVAVITRAVPELRRGDDDDDDP